MLYVSAAAAVSVGREGFIALTGSSVASYHSVYVYSVRALTQTHALSRRLSNWKAFAMQPRTRPYSLYRINVYNFYIHTPTYIYIYIEESLLIRPLPRWFYCSFSVQRARGFSRGRPSGRVSFYSAFPAAPSTTDANVCTRSAGCAWAFYSLSLSPSRICGVPLFRFTYFVYYLSAMCVCVRGGDVCVRAVKGSAKFTADSRCGSIAAVCVLWDYLHHHPATCVRVLFVCDMIYIYIRYYFDIIVGLISRFWFFEYILNCLCAADFQRQPEVADKARRIIPHHTHRASL